MMKVVMMGATGAVGTEVVNRLKEQDEVASITLLGRRRMDNLQEAKISQEIVDVLDPSTYKTFLPNHSIAICTLGVGQPSKISKADFLKIDKTAVLDFATQSKNAGVKHFQLLSSVGINSTSRSFYLRTKGELVDEIQKLGFNRFSVFKPSMILTPKNRYGLSQGILLKLWPLLNFVLIGSLKKYRGVKVKTLGTAIANNSFTQKDGVEYLTWENFQGLNL